MHIFNLANLDYSSAIYMIFIIMANQSGPEFIYSFVICFHRAAGGSTDESDHKNEVQLHDQ